DPADVLPPRVAAEPAGDGVEPRPLRGGDERGGAEVDPPDVLAPGQAGQVAVGEDVHAVVGAGGVAVRGAVRRRAVAEVDPADVLAPDKAGRERACETGALSAGGRAG